MFGTVIEALLVRAPMGLVHLTMKFPVRSMITSMSTIIFVMSQCRCGWSSYGPQRCRNESFADGHGTYPVQAAPLAEARNRFTTITVPRRS